MPLTVQQKSKDRVWDSIGYKMRETLQKAGVEADVDALSDELFELMWPGIFEEITTQVDRALEDIPLVGAMQDRIKSLRENEGN